MCVEVFEPTLADGRTDDFLPKMRKRAHWSLARYVVSRKSADALYRVG